MEVIAYFNEYLKSKNIDFIKYENTGIKVGLSDSMKSLKDQAKNYIDRISTDLELIDTQEHNLDVLVDYKLNGFDVSKAILSVTARYKAIEEAKAKAEQQAQIKVEETKAVEQVTILARPKVEVKEETYDMAFKIKNATLPKLKSLKEFLNNGGYEYEE
jgi:hypothetical protein